MKLHEFLSQQMFFNLSSETRGALAAKIAEMLGDDYLLSPPGNGADARLVHREAKLEFALCPGGEFEFGLNSNAFLRISNFLKTKEVRDASAFVDEEDFTWLLRELAKREVHRVSPFLIATSPVSIANTARTGQDKFVDPYFAIANDLNPARATFKVASEICRTLGMVLPHETQWECAAKCWTHEIFCFDFDMVVNEAYKFLTSSAFESRANLAQTSNRIGLHGLGVCSEWTSSTFSSFESFEARNDVDGSEQRYASLRGGGGDTWPWQHSDEFIAGILTTRTSGEIANEESKFAFRPVLSLDQFLNESVELP